MIKTDYCGYHTHNPEGERIYRPGGTSSYLFLLVLSPMLFYLKDGQEQQANPGACILFTPGTYQNYKAKKDFFNSFVHFYGETEQIEERKLRTNELFYPDNHEEIHWILKKIHQESIHKMSGHEEMLDLYVRQLMMLIRRGQQQEEIPRDQRQNIYQELLALREQMLSRCEEPWNINQICSILNIGKSQLYKYYDQFFHCSPKEELIQARLQKTKYLMTNEATTIRQAAFESGFQNIHYFNRLFKSQCGCTPGEYRKKHHLGD